MEIINAGMIIPDYNANCPDNGSGCKVYIPADVCVNDYCVKDGCIVECIINI